MTLDERRPRQLGCFDDSAVDLRRGVDLSVDIGTMHMANPVMVASGTFGYGTEYENRLGYETEGLGAIVLKSVTLHPRQGNPTPRAVETYGGLLNSIGLQNIGIDRLLSEILPSLRRLNTNVIVNIAGSSVDEYGKVAAKLHTAHKSDFSAVEINVSCPNVRQGGIQFGMKCELVSDVVKAVRSELPHVPLITKLTPNAPDIAEIAVSAVESGSDAVSLINTVPGMAIDIRKRRPVMANNVGGLSGPAIKPIALLKVHQVFQAFSLAGLDAPIIGMGGIRTWSDAVEFMLAGATAVSVGTANFYDPDCCRRLVQGIGKYLEEQSNGTDLPAVRDIIGTLVLNT